MCSTLCHITCISPHLSSSCLLAHKAPFYVFLMLYYLHCPLVHGHIDIELFLHWNPSFPGWKRTEWSFVWPALLSMGAFGVFPMVQMWNYHWYRWLPMVPMVATKLRTVYWHTNGMIVTFDWNRKQQQVDLYKIKLMSTFKNLKNH